MEKITLLIGRILIGHIFVLSGWSKIGAIAGTQSYMASVGLPGFMIYPTIALEIGAGLAVIIGFKARWAALALALFSIVSALFFHTDFANQMQMIMFMKNFAMAGGLLYVYAMGPGTLSLDGK